MDINKRYFDKNASLNFNWNRIISMPSFIRKVKISFRTEAKIDRLICYIFFPKKVNMRSAVEIKWLEVLEYMIKKMVIRNQTISNYSHDISYLIIQNVSYRELMMFVLYQFGALNCNVEEWFLKSELFHVSSNNLSIL